MMNMRYINLILISVLIISCNHSRQNEVKVQTTGMNLCIDSAFILNSPIELRYDSLSSKYTEEFVESKFFYRGIDSENNWGVGVCLTKLDTSQVVLILDRFVENAKNKAKKAISNDSFKFEVKDLMNENCNGKLLIGIYISSSGIPRSYAEVIILKDKYYFNIIIAGYDKNNSRVDQMINNMISSIKYVK